MKVPPDIQALMVDHDFTMYNTSSQCTAKIPVLLLKTRSQPHDGYEEYFQSSTAAASAAGLSFDPTFVPVLEHTFDSVNLEHVRGLLRERAIRRDGGRYGGMIFTSQRAVEAFARIVEEGQSPAAASPDEADNSWPYLQDIPIYTVGPATCRALKSIVQTPPLEVYGEEMGNGEALAHYMLSDYNKRYAHLEVNPPLLFLVGEQRRDIIPKTLMAPHLGRQRIEVEELTVYDTGVMATFATQFSELLRQTEANPARWVVVFSPTGCADMLSSLDLLDPTTNRAKTGERGGGCGNRKANGGRKTYIATIGPTTRDYLRKQFGFEPDVCAEKPSPAGVGEGIRRFMEQIAQN